MMCIYAGAIYKITSERNGLVYMEGILGSETADHCEVTEIPEDIYIQAEAEYKESLEKLKDIEQRTYRLNDEYYKKAQALLKKHYEEIHFNRMEFVQHLGLTVKYEAYSVLEIN